MKYWLCLPRISFWCLEIFYEGHCKIWKVIVKVETPFINISRDLLERKSQFFNPQNYLYELSYFTAWSAQIWSFSWSVFSLICNRKNPYFDTFHAVQWTKSISEYLTHHVQLNISEYKQFHMLKKWSS